LRFVKPKKALGQHFLNDIGVAERIVESLSPSQNVLEIGPGTGILTKILIKKLINGESIENEESLANPECFKEFELVYKNLKNNYAE